MAVLFVLFRTNQVIYLVVLLIVISKFYKFNINNLECKLQLIDSTDPFDTRERKLNIKSTQSQHLFTAIELIVNELVKSPKGKYENFDLVYNVNNKTNNCINNYAFISKININ